LHTLTATHSRSTLLEAQLVHEEDGYAAEIRRYVAGEVRNYSPNARAYTQSSMHMRMHIAVDLSRHLLADRGPTAAAAVDRLNLELFNHVLALQPVVQL
jgi:hypothetical protein